MGVVESEGASRGGSPNFSGVRNPVGGISRRGLFCPLRLFITMHYLLIFIHKGEKGMGASVKAPQTGERISKGKNREKTLTPVL